MSANYLPGTRPSCSRSTRRDDFPGSNRPHDRRIRRRGRRRCAPSQGRRTCCSSCSTTPASASSAATARRSTRRTSTGSRQNGLRYTNMHTTALCSPTRSCMLTGRNHHSNAMACITEGSEGYPGSNGTIPFENGFLSEMLLGQGYNTYAIGKWHLTPAEQISAAGPYDRWPLGRGFERFYGFLGGDTSQYYPDLVYDNHQVEPPKTPEEGYHLTRGSGRQGDQFIADPSSSRPTSRSSCTSPPARCTRRITCRRSGPTSTRASSTTAGTRIARRSSRGRRSSASSRRIQCCRAMTPTCRTGTSCRPTSAGSTRA